MYLTAQKRSIVPTVMNDSARKRGRPRSYDREDAINSAIELFLQKGFEGTSLEDLTEKLQMNKPSLYAAFGNKEQLFITVLDVYHSIYQEFLEELIKQELKPRAFIDRWLNWFLENYKEQCNPMGCLIVNSTTLCKPSYPQLHKHIKKFHDKNDRLLSNYFKSAIQKGELSESVNPKALAQYYNNTIQGMAVLKRVQDNSSALNNIKDIAMKSFDALVS